ncbi:hypothetical protein [Mangrovihabitans endophyticus]|uniref:beta-xylosidase family glycoside hydrolase n=1 Tax=Mangrovihabitans endophyticus TaxID=1751298 RepID=UPI001E47FEA9|nr:hypothetical protein [Mangrovihabitans endophyticus]
MIWQDFADGDIIRVGDAYLYGARNTLTRRIPGPSATATIRLDYAAMANGDRAGLAMLRDQSAWIGVRKDNGATFAPLGPAFTLTNDWHFFMGYRFGVFNYATFALGGAVTVSRFEVTTP